VCLDAENSALSDIIEIDAASNNGVDDIRDLREKALYTPERCKYKIYIIDETHMLSKEAFNALLKIMEEPPPHVKFILATTEVHKVPPTILSRCQRFDFRRIMSSDITERLLFIAQEENIRLDREAAELISKTADGGMRDALSLLDQCIAFSEEITPEIVSDAAGIAGRDYLFDIIEAIAGANAAKAIDITDRLYSMSKDLQRLCAELTEQFRNVMIYKALPGNASAIVCMPNELERIKSVAARLSLDDILNRLDLLQKCNERMPRSGSKRVEFEMCLIKLCVGIDSNPDVSELLTKIDSLEKRLANMPASSAQAYAAADSPRRYAPKEEPSRTSYYEPPEVPVSSPVPAAGEQTSKQEAPSGQSLRIEDFKELNLWPEILEEFSKVCPSVSGALNGSRAFVNQGIMLIYTENPFFLPLLKNKENAAKLQASIKTVTGSSYIIKAKCAAKPQENENAAENLILKAKSKDIPTERVDNV
jgi:DNA polymerase-3 subunit gamma/tau